ncbi:site-specific DNA-methyltransferase [Anderseniella sp. Alg231-50]|uniref:site-specific DNA-methyltransferase n=1 Tax=Anderseniella sp. Alg231-50 TaxID=1922226 RepID=UPI00307C3D2C
MSDEIEYGDESGLEKLDLTTPNFTDQNIQRIADLFPNVVTEGRDDDGNVKHVIDFDALKQELSDNIVEGPQERYHLNWPGKKKAMLAANAPINKSLRPCRQESVDFDTTKNLFIEGDNLDALKLLQETYLGKVKLIYIDPPYNTGKDFIYRDNFTADKDQYLEESGQRDEEGGRLVANPESNGRYHSDWLSMMYPRLKLARNLLRDDGVIFISIDDGEVSALQKMCEELFGSGNFVANIVWQKKYSPQNDATYFSDMHDHILVFAKNRRDKKSDTTGWNIDLLPRTEEQNARYTNRDDDPRGVWKAGDASVKSYSASYDYEIITPSGRVVRPPNGRCWFTSKENMKNLMEQGRIWFGEDGSNVPAIKQYLTDVKDGRVPTTWWTYEECGHNQEAKKEVNSLLPEYAGVFDTPKPIRLMKRILELSTKEDSDALIMDFFVGSASLPHAVQEFNSIDSGKRTCISVQISEKIQDTELDSIADLSKERIRRAGTKILEEYPDLAGKLDVGFRALKIDSSNMTDVWHSPERVSQDDLLSQVSNIKPDRTSEDLLFQVLLDWGVDLTLPISCESMQSKEVFFVDDNALAACFETGISEALVKQIAEREPLRVVFRDGGFDCDATKINAEQLFKHLSPHTEVKVI